MLLVEASLLFLGNPQSLPLKPEKPWAFKSIQIPTPMSSLELLVLTSVFFSLLFSKDIPGFPDLDNPKDVRIFCILLARAVITVSQTKVVPVLVGWDGIMALGSLLSKKQGREVHVLCS